jgi:hypothetical protein
MDANESRTAATVFTWISVGVAITVTAIFADNVLLPLAAILGAFAFFSTGIIWKDNRGEDAKPKRDVSSDLRVQLLMQLMDDEDREQLKRRLLNDLQGDGEIMTVEDLVNSKNGR